MITCINREKGLPFALSEDWLSNVQDSAYILSVKGTHYVYYVGNELHCCSLDSFASKLFDGVEVIFEVSGSMNDDLMCQVNGLLAKVSDERDSRKGVGECMGLLCKEGCGLEYVKVSSATAQANLVKCGGLEMPAIVGGMIKALYYDRGGVCTSLEECLDILAERDVAGYAFNDLKSAYRCKLVQLLHSLFMGMRFDEEWNCRQGITGGYIVKIDEENHYATIPSEFYPSFTNGFDDFLLSSLSIDVPNEKVCQHLGIQKQENKYFMRLSLCLKNNCAYSVHLI